MADHLKNSGTGRRFPPSIHHQLSGTPIRLLRLTDLKRVRAQIIRDTGMAPQICVFSDQTADMFIANEEVKEQLDRLHLVVGRVEPDRPIGTAQYLGKLLLPALELWTYSEEYISEEDGISNLPFIPPHCCLVGTVDPYSGYSYYGSILQLDEGGFEEVYNSQFVPRMFFDIKNEIAELRMQQRIALVPTDCASWTVIECVPPSAGWKRKANPAIPAIESEKDTNPHTNPHNQPSRLSRRER